MINYINKYRKKLALLLVVFIVFFILVAAYNIYISNTISYEIEKLEESRQEGLEEYKEIQITNNKSNLNLIQDQWDVFVSIFEYDDYEKEEYIDKFIEFISPIKKHEIAGPLVLYNPCEDILHFVEVREEKSHVGYDSVNWTNLDLDESIKYRDTLPNTPFGVGNRYYYETKELNIYDCTYYAITGFDEQNILSFYIDSIEPDYIERQKEFADIVFYVNRIFLFISIIFGFLALYYTNKIIALRYHSVDNMPTRERLDEMSKDELKSLVKDLIFKRRNRNNDR